jgi:cytochrome bd-type quinol oxidase subunit 2
MPRKAKPVARTNSTHLAMVCLACVLLTLIFSGICAFYTDSSQATKVWDIISHTTTAVVSGLLGMIAGSRR